MQVKLITKYITLTCLCVACNNDTDPPDTRDAANADGSSFVVGAGDVRMLLRRIDAETRNVKSARYVATVGQVGDPAPATFAMTVKRDTNCRPPYYGKIVLGSTTKPGGMAFDGRSIRVSPLESSQSFAEAPARLILAVFSDTWIHFVHPTPFQEEIDAPIATLQGEDNVTGRRCSIVNVEYKSGQRARWYFDRQDGLPRRVERLSTKDGKESVRVVTISQLRINETIADDTFNIGRRVIRFSEETARHLSRIYALTNPLNEGDVRAYLSDNHSSCGENGEVVQLAKELGTALRAAGVASYDPGAEERAHRIAADTGAPSELAPEVARSLNSGSLELWQLGNELLWLAEVLPPAA